jgi:predicted nucleotidyltransferase
MIAIDNGKITDAVRKIQSIRFAYIFGSRITNITRFGSDLDIALYFEEEPRLMDIGMLVNDLEKAAKCTVDIVSLKNLYNKNPKLAYSVVDKGILLFCLDEELLTEYKKKAYLKYLDFKPVIDLFAGKLNERIFNNKFAIVER